MNVEAGWPVLRIVVYVLGAPFAILCGIVLGIWGGVEISLEGWARFVREWRRSGKKS